MAKKIRSIMQDKEAQKAFEKAYPDLDFQKIFGKNYLTENERAYERDASLIWRLGGWGNESDNRN